MFRSPVIRELTVTVKVVQLSAIYLVLALLIVVLCCFSNVKCQILRKKYHRTVHTAPDSKLDWVLQSIDEHGSQVPRKGSLCYLVVLEENDVLQGLSRAKRNRMKFENAIYRPQGLQQDLAMFGSEMIAQEKTAVVGASETSGFPKVTANTKIFSCDGPVRATDNTEQTTIAIEEVPSGISTPMCTPVGVDCK